MIPLTQLAVSGGDDVRSPLDISPLLHGQDHSDMQQQVKANNADMMQQCAVIVCNTEGALVVVNVLKYVLLLLLLLVFLGLLLRLLVG